MCEHIQPREYDAKKCPTCSTQVSPITICVSFSLEATFCPEKISGLGVRLLGVRNVLLSLAITLFMEKSLPFSGSQL